MICVFLGLSQTDTFILGYFPFLMIVLLIGTLSCDEADNGLPFLFTLPIDRKLYIREKYLFCVAGTVVSFVLAWALYLVSLLVHGVSNVSGVLSEKCGNDTGLSGGIFHHHFHHDSGADQNAEQKSARVMMAGICFLFAGVILFVQKVAGESDTGSNHGADWHHYGHNSGPGRNFYCRHRGFADLYRISVGFMEKQEF